jgi:signal transduction histidine kinase
LWATRDQSVWVWDPPSRKAHVVYRGSPQPSYYELHPILYYKERMWCCTFDSLIVIDPNTEQMVLRMALPFEKQLAPTSIRVHQLLPDGDQLWVASIAGLWRLNTTTLEWKAYRHRANDPQSLGEDVVFCLLKDEHRPRWLWLGTNGGGLNRLDIESGMFEHYTTAQGLPNNVVYQVLQDKQGYLWMSTNKGLARFDATNRSFVNYNISDGLQSNEFDRYSACASSDGMFYFGGINGLTYFQPEQQNAPLRAPRTVFEAFSSRNGPLRDEWGYVIEPMSTSSIELVQGDAFLMISFAALDYFSASKVLYRYRLAGLSDDWISLSNNNQLTFNALPAGEYTLTIAASSGNDVWSDMPAQLGITVHPAWWATWWFRLLVVLVVGGILYAIYRIREQRFRELQRVRDHIARDLHDEIGSSLSSISIYSRLVRQHPDKKIAEYDDILQRITTTSLHMLEAISDIVWTINSANDQYSNLIQRMRVHATEITEAKGMQLHFNADPQIERMKLSTEKRRNLYLIYKEAINNAMKYAHADTIHIALERKGDGAVMRIADNGKGFDTSKKSMGNGIRNMHQRAATVRGELQITSSEATGTTIQLYFS